MKMKVLVTGGAGFVGSHVCEYYANKGDDVVSIDNLSRGNLLGKEINNDYNWNFLKGFSNIELIKDDVRDLKALRNSMDGIDLVIHCAAQTAVTSSLQDPLIDFEVNALGTLNILEAARLSTSDPTMLYCSTNKVYGENVNEIPVKESGERYEFADLTYSDGIPIDFPIDSKGHSPYGVSKLTGDQYMRDYYETYGLKTVSFRMSCIYGTRQFGVEDQGWVAHFVISSILGKPLTIFGDGKQVRDVLFVTDLVKAFDLGAENIDKTRGNAYNVGGGPENTLSLLELINILKDFGLSPRYDFAEWRPSDQKVYISDVSGNKEFNWEPETSREEGLRLLFNWVKEDMMVFD